MNDSILAIYDKDQIYADLLSKQLLRIPNHILQIHCFTSRKQLKQFQEQDEIMYLLVGESLEKEIYEFQAKYYFCLVTDREKMKQERDTPKIMGMRKQIHYIYKYQATEDIYHAIVRSGQGLMTQGVKTLENTEEESQFIGVYNPVHRSGQSTFARALCHVLGGKNFRVLYLNMEEYSGKCRETKEVGGLAELLYYTRQEKNQVITKLQQLQTETTYTAVPPIHVSSMLKNVEAEEWKALFEIIIQSREYQFIVVDLDGVIRGHLELLAMCSIIYMPIRENGGETKRLQFLENLKILKTEQLVKQIEEVRMPEFDADKDEEIERLMEIHISRML